MSTLLPKSYWKRIYRRKTARKRKIYICATRPYKHWSVRLQKWIWATTLYYKVAGDDRIRTTFRVLSYDVKKRPLFVEVTQGGIKRRLRFCTEKDTRRKK